jgi:hypothetical protein
MGGGWRCSIAVKIAASPVRQGNPQPDFQASLLLAAYTLSFIQGKRSQSNAADRFDFSVETGP